MTAPVIITLAKPSASGSVAAASDPKTASRITRTIGKPIFSALSRSSFVRSCMPAQSACWPTRYGSTPPRAEVPSSSLKSTAMFAVSSRSPSTFSGTTVIEADAASRFAAAAARGASSTLGSRSAMRPARSTWARTAAGSALGAPREDDRELIALSALEAGDVLGDHLRLRAGHLEPSAREVLRLAGGEWERREDHQQPGGQNQPPAPFEQSRHPVHCGLHPSVDTRNGAPLM